MKNEIFLNSAFIIALASKTDSFHEKALQISETLDGKILVTTQAIMLKVGNALSKRSFRKAGVALLNSLETDDNVTIISLSDKLFTKGVELYSKRIDKEWGLLHLFCRHARTRHFTTPDNRHSFSTSRFSSTHA